MKDTHTLKSGRVLVLQLAAFSVSMRLLKAVMSEVKAVDLGNEFKLGAEIRIDSLKEADLPVDAIKNLVCQVAGSDAVEAALRECLKSCLYDGQKIVVDTFENEDARGDYFPVAWEVIKFNLAPFFSNLGLKLSASKAPDTSAPGSG